MPLRPHLSLSDMVKTSGVSERVAAQLFGDKSECSGADPDVLASLGTLAKIDDQIVGLHSAIEDSMRQCPDTDTARAFASLYIENAKNTLRYLSKLRGEAGCVIDVDVENVETPI